MLKDVLGPKYIVKHLQVGNVRINSEVRNSAPGSYCIVADH